MLLLLLLSAAPLLLRVMLLSAAPLLLRVLLPLSAAPLLLLVLLLGAAAPLLLRVLLLGAAPSCSWCCSWCCCPSPTPGGVLHLLTPETRWRRTMQHKRMHVTGATRVMGCGSVSAQ